MTKIFVCGISPTPRNAKVLKTSLDAEKYVPWEYHAQVWRLLKKLRADGLWLIALEQTKKSQNIFKYKPPRNRKIALIVGNEVRGLNKKILSLADKIVEIPMYGKKESLNVAVATGIALYKIVESRK